MLTLAIANAKGGTGKTTIAVHLAAGFASKGRRVVLVDLDLQAHATAWLGAPGATEGNGPTSAEALTAGALRGLPGPIPGHAGLTVLPATPALAQSDLQLAGEVGGTALLGRALASLDADLAILDCPPNLGITVLAALCASDAVLCPVAPAFLPLAGLQRVEDTVRKARERLDARVRVLGYVLFAVDNREGIAGEARQLLQGEKPDRLLASEVRVSAAAKALPATHRTAWDAGADPRGADDYAALLAEVTQRLEAVPRRRAK